jgi:hypothetical protein
MIKKQIAYIAFSGWLILIYFLLILVQNVDITVFFVFGFIGFLTMLKLIEPKFIQPTYMQYFWYFIVIGLAIFAVIATYRTMINF